MQEARGQQSMMFNKNSFDSVLTSIAVFAGPFDEPFELILIKRRLSFAATSGRYGTGTSFALGNKKMSITNANEDERLRFTTRARRECSAC